MESYYTAGIRREYGDIVIDKSTRNAVLVYFDRVFAIATI